MRRTIRLLINTTVLIACRCEAAFSRDLSATFSG